MTLDTVTLLLVLACVSLISGAFLTFLRVSQPGTVGMESMAASMVAFGAGFGLIAARSFVPDIMSFTLANSLICGGYLLSLRGYRLFSGRTFSDVYACLFFATYVVEFSYFFHVQNVYWIRLFFYLSTYAVVALVLVRETTSDFRSTGHRSYLVALAFAGFIAVVLLGTGALSIGYTGAADILSLTAINAAVLLGQIFFIVGWTLSFALIVTEKAGYYDSLTGLPNRRMLREVLSRTIRTAESRGNSFLLFILDLDRFKEVNDTLGHLTGDDLLKRVGERIGRAIEGRRSFVARLGGDEFAIIIPDAGQSDARGAAETMTRALRHPFTINGLHIASGASVGVAVFPVDGRDASSLLRCADVAMYTAKRTQIHFSHYEACADVYSAERLSLLAELSDTLRREPTGLDPGGLVLHFQPIVRLCDDAVTGMEALVRWRHPRHGLLPPGSWLPLAEMSDLIEDLTAWVLDAAIRQARSWNESGNDWNVKINVSARNLVDQTFPGVLREALTRHGVAPGDVELEITETAMMADPDRAFAMLREITDLGVKIAVDDFGVGYSSFWTLRRVPGLASVKIDQAFVRRMADDGADIAVVKSVISLARDLEICSIAEGVEDHRTFALLKSIGCREAQGFFIARPMSAEAIDVWWARRAAESLDGSKAS